MASRDFKQRVIFELVDDASTNARRIDKALEAMNAELNRTDTVATRSQTRLSQFSDFLRRRFVITFGDVQRAVSAAMATIQETITLEGQEQALRGQLDSIGVGFDEFIEKLDQAASGTVSTANLIEASSRALLLGIPAEEIANLLEIAGSRAQATGQSVAKAFEDITTGIGRASPLILDNLGFVVRLEEVYGEYATTLGKTAEELSKSEQSQALLNVVLRQGKADFEELGTAAENTFLQIQQGQAALQNFLQTVSQLATAIGVTLASALAEVARVFIDFAANVSAAVGALAEFGRDLPGVGDGLGRLADNATRAATRLDEMSDSVIATRDSLADLGKNQAAAALGFEDVGQAAERAARRSDDYVESMRTVRAETEGAAQATNELGGALEQEEVRLGDIIRTTDRYTEATQRAAQTAERFTRATGGTVTARDRRSRADVEEALRAGRTPFQGGTRIRTADGSGSRLLR